jgi:glycosyltransferase involved in cell wall biosynthesis
MKILFVTGTYFPSTNGVAVSARTTMETLVRKGHEVTVLAPKVPGYKDTSNNIIRYPSLPNPLNKDYPLPVFPLSFKIVKHLLDKDYDIVHTHHPFHIGWFAEKYAQLGKIPLVFTHHTKYEDYADIYLKFLSKKARTDIVRCGVAPACKHADLIVSPSKSMARILEKKYPSVVVGNIPTGVNLAPTSESDKGYLRDTFNISDDTTVLLSLSRLAEEKNVALAIYSLAILPGKYHLFIVGSGPMDAELKELVIKLKIRDKVTFLGRIEHKEVPKIMKAADIFLFPSITEMQPLNLLEALSSGLPVAAVKSEVSEEWVPNEVGIQTENNPNDFAKAVIELNTRCCEDQTRAITKWASRFTSDNTTNVLLEKYQEVIDKRKLTLLL